LQTTVGTTSPEAAAPASASASADFNIKILAPLEKYLRDCVGGTALGDVCREAGLAPSDFEGPPKWISWEQFETFLAEVRKRVADDREFSDACVYRIAEGYGPIRFLTWATSPRSVMGLAERTGHLFCAVGRFKVVGEGENFIKLTYTSSKPESRLMCLSRQAQSVRTPCLWGLPPAFLKEGKCIAKGDDCCEYTFYMFERARKWPVVLGGLLGGAVFMAAEYMGLSAVATGPLFVALGASIAIILERQRKERVSTATHHEIAEALRQVVNDDAEARRELIDFHQRQREWARVLEGQATARQADIQRFADSVRDLDAAHASTLRGVSHDLRNPLSVVLPAIEYVRSTLPVGASDAKEALEEAHLAVTQINELLSHFVRLADQRRPLVELSPQPMEAHALVDRLGRRLRAFARGRDIRVVVNEKPGAPAVIHVDPILIDRVTDNLLTNAVKYTERGTITLEIGGVPGFMVLTVADTGRGIAPEALERIFKPGGSDPAHRAAGSHGVGLSVVVDLLAYVGGRLEVASAPGKGTTFEIHFPIEGKAPPQSTDEMRKNPTRGVLSKVVTIRKTAP
jgi:signal transduction histidine kinase